jgi:outer membrane immunogenic protein
MRAKLLCAAAAVVLSASVTTALAADKVPVKPAPVAVVAKPAFSWTGIYAGFSAGWAMSRFNWAFDPPAVGPNQTFTLQRSLFEGDVQVGFQHQVNHLVWGIEGQGLFFLPTWASHDGYGIGSGGQAQARIATAYTVGPRLGIAQANHLFYVTGGYATGHIETRDRAIATGAILLPTSVDHNGWFAGGGFDWAVSKYTIVGVEYQHLAFNSAFHCASTPCVAPNSNNHDISATADVVSFRLSWLIPIK